MAHYAAGLQRFTNQPEQKTTRNKSPMKMIMAIMEDHFSDATSSVLVKENFRVTRLASTGGLLREGATTLMVGVEDEKLDTALELIREQIPPSDDQSKIRVTIYVLSVKDFRRV